MTCFKAITFSAALMCTALPSLGFAQETINVINPLPRSTVFYPLVVGEMLGYFAAEGVTVNLLPSDTSIPYVAFVQNGQADLAMLDPVETINAINAGAKISTIYEVMQNAPEGIAVAGDSPITDVAELVGTTVGLVSDRDRSFLQAAMAASGHSIDDVSTVVLGESGPTLAAAIRDHTVSAISGSVFDWAGLQASGAELKLITPKELLSSPANTFAINTAAIEDRRAAMEGFLRAWSKGMYVAKVHPEVVEKMLRQAVPEEWEDEAAGKSLLAGVLPMNISQTERLGDVEPAVWTGIQPRMLSSGAISAEVDVSTFLNDTYIAAANDFDRDEVAAQAEAWLAANP